MPSATPTAPSTTFDARNPTGETVFAQPGRHELEADPLLGGPRVEPAGELREPAGVAVVEPLEQRVGVDRLGLGVRPGAAQGRLTLARGLRDELADDDERAGETDECEQQQHLASPLDRDDLLEDERADDHHHERGDDHELPGRLCERAARGSRD